MEITVKDLVAYMPMSQIIEALDDNGDGVLDKAVWQSIVDANQRRISDLFNATAIPTQALHLCQSALLLLCASTLYTRRGFYGEANPLHREATAAMERLARIASAAEPLPDATRGDAITQPAKIAGTGAFIL